MVALITTPNTLLCVTRMCFSGQVAQIFWFFVLCTIWTAAATPYFKRTWVISVVVLDVVCAWAPKVRALVSNHLKKRVE